MKIIDNKKDYYDYVSGIYGIDEDITYDRRGSIPSKQIKETIHEFDNEVLPYPTNEWTYVTVVAGVKIWNIELHREIVSGKIKLSARLWTGKRTYKVYKYIPPSFPFSEHPESYLSKESPLVLLVNVDRWWGAKGMVIKNPILSGLPIVSLLPAEEVWQGIYDYLIKIREPDITDNRTDIEKLEAHGFDKKTSFRKDKKSRN